jgi:hypothetical protein
MPADTTYWLTARLLREPDTAALLRVVSILHARCANVRHLAFDAPRADCAVLTALVTLTNAGPHTLEESLLRAVEVLEATVEAAQPPWTGEPATVEAAIVELAVTG